MTPSEASSVASAAPNTPTADAPLYQPIRTTAKPKTASKGGISPLAAAAIAVVAALLAVGVYIAAEQAATPAPYVYVGNPENNVPASSFHPGEPLVPAAPVPTRRHKHKPPVEKPVQFK